MKHGGFAKTLGVLLVAAVVVCIVVYVGLQPPFGKPREANRVTHDAGFSIIKPDNWSTQTYFRNREETATNAFSFVDERLKGAPSSFAVSQLNRPEKVENLKQKGAVETAFQGRPAWRIERRRKLEQNIQIYADIDGQWYLFTLGKPHRFSEDSLTPFIESFRLETPKPSTLVPAPASQTATDEPPG